MADVVQKLTSKSWQVGGYETALKNLTTERNEIKLNELKFVPQQ